MGITAHEGPLVTFGQGTSSDSNPEAGPSAWYQGDMILDPRNIYTYQPGQPSTAATNGWLTSNHVPVIDWVPAALSATNIANDATTASGQPVVLAASSVAGVTVGCSITNALTGALVTGLVGLDVNVTRTVTTTFTSGLPKIAWTGVVPNGVQVGDTVTWTTSGALPAGLALLTTYYVVAIGALHMMVSATKGGTPIVMGAGASGTNTAHFAYTATQCQPPVNFGQGSGALPGPMRAWNPNWAFSRAVTITSNGNDGSGFYTVNGFDIYGYPMTQTVAGVSSTTVTTTKCFKYIQSIIPTGTIASTTLTVGGADVWGLPLRTDTLSYLTILWGNNPAPLIAYSAPTFVAADVDTATATTGDVRGTIYAGSASDGTKRLIVFWSPEAKNMNSTLGLLGQPQF